MSRRSASRWLEVRILALALGCLALGPIARPQEVDAPEEAAPTVMAPPDMKAGVLRALAAPYLSPDEAAAKRVFHGVWRPEDLEDPALRAKAALIVGSYDDPSLLDPAASIEDRAEGAIRRGDVQEGLELLGDASSIRASRIRAEGLEILGLYEQARDAIKPITDVMKERRLDDAEDLVEGARALLIRARLEGRPGSEYRQVLRLLTRAHEELDRLYWPAILAQAQLLNDADERQGAIEALQDVLSMNPRAAGAWRLLGEMAVDTFNFDQVEAAVVRLNRDLAYFNHGDEATEESASHHAAMLLARAAIRQSNPDDALEALAPILEMYPKMREALAMRIGATSLLYDEQRLEQLLGEFDELSMGSAQGLYEAGRALAEDRQYGQAAEMLERAIELQPNWDKPWVELGLLEVQSGRNDKALAALRRATELDPFDLRARNSLTLIEELIEYDTIEIDGFIIRFKPGTDEVMAREMVQPLEEIFEIVTSEFDHVPPQKTVIEVMPDHQWFAVRIAGMPQLHTIAASTGPLIAMEAPKFGKKGLHSGPYDWVRVIRHEYVHTVMLSLTRNRVPLWFTEGAAVHLESDARDYNTCELLTAALTEDFLHDMSAINIAFTRPKTRYDRQLAYAQGNWMYEYIIYRWGERAPIDIMLLYRDGVRTPEAFRRVLGVSVDEFFEQFKQWARADAASWGMLPEPPVNQLLVEETLRDPERRREVLDRIAEAAVDLARVLTLGGEMKELELPIVEMDDDLLARLLEEHPDHSSLLRAEVNRRMSATRGVVDEATVPWLERYAESRPVDPSPHRLLARYFLESDDTSRAIPHLLYLDEREQKSAAYAIELARQYAKLREWDKAWVEITRAVEIAPFDAGHRELAATVALRRGDLESAERHIQALTELEPQHELHRRRLEAVRKRIAERESEQ